MRRTERYPQIGVADLADDTLILDVREPSDYAAGHAPGAVSIPLAEFLASQGLALRNLVGGTTAWDAAGKPLLDASGQPGAVVAPSTPPPARV